MEDADFLEGGDDGADYHRGLERREQAAHYAALEGVRLCTWPCEAAAVLHKLPPPPPLPPGAGGTTRGGGCGTHADGAGGV